MYRFSEKCKSVDFGPKKDPFTISLNVPIPDKKKKLTEIFNFTLLCGVSKGFF